MTGEKLSLTELQLMIRDSLYLTLPEMYWVIAEISEIRENYSGHCYLELVEKHPEEHSVRARVRAVVWSNRYRFLKALFENTTGQSLKEGLKILIRVKIEYHEIYGLSLVINDIDPAFTIGEMALRRQQIIMKLEEEGILNMNKELEFPIVPQRIAIISSRNAAGYNDFMKHLTENNFGYRFYTVLIDAPMQGSETEGGVIAALDKVASRIGLFDVVVIIRGGGSQTDLSWFDNYNIAYYITQFPLPVLTGIGHEKDMSVTDIVAHMALKTPTAVADYLVECMNNADNHLMEMSTSIMEKAEEIVRESRERVDSFRMKLIPLARLMISDIREKLSGQIIKLVNTGKGYLMRSEHIPANQRSRLVSSTNSLLSAKTQLSDRNKTDLRAYSAALISGKLIRIESLSNSLNILNPENVLRRGFTITSRHGKIIKLGSELKSGDLISTRFSDGSVSSRVEEPLEEGKEDKDEKSER